MIGFLKTLVGSRAHGIEREDSDFDYRGVFVVPTNELLSIGAKIKNTSWIEGQTDNTSWEIGHFLEMAIHSNPNVLEVFFAPVVETVVVRGVDWGDRLRKLFPYVWSSKGVYDAYLNYSHNQRAKLLETQEKKRSRKYSLIYLMILHQGINILKNGELVINFSNSPIFETLKAVRDGQLSVGEIINICIFWEKELEDAYMKNKNKEVDYNKVNDFLLEVRKEFFQ